MKKEIQDGYIEIELSDDSKEIWITQQEDSIYLSKDNMEELVIILNNYLNPLTDIK